MNAYIRQRIISHLHISIVGSNNSNVIDMLFLYNKISIFNILSLFRCCKNERQYKRVLSHTLLIGTSFWTLRVLSENKLDVI